MIFGWLLIVILVSLTLAVVAVALDTVLQRGYGLGAFVLAALVLALWGSSVLAQAEQGVVSSAASLEVVAFAFAYFVGLLCLALALALSAVIETVMARQWWWLGIIVIVSVVPAVFIITSSPALKDTLLGAPGLPPSVESLVLLLPPVLVTCAYALARSVHRPLVR